MKPQLMNQPNWKPTRKHFTGAVAGIATAAVLTITSDLASSHQYLSFLSGEAALAGIPVIMYFLVGYLFRERTPQ